jgi:hypothetical protein
MKLQGAHSSRLGILAGIGLAAVTFVTSTAYATAPSPAFIPPTADWLTSVNYYRAMAGLSPVVEDSAMSAGAVNHSCYMLYNGISHDEVAGLTGYTAEGDVAGNNGNVAVSSQINTSARSHVELWMTGPFHAIGVLRPNLRSTGFGKCDLPDTPTTWHSGATLDVLRGLVSAPRPSSPILFPGDGATTNLDRFVVESPNPLTYCGWTGSAGLPIIAMMPEVANSAGASLVGPNGPIDVCVLSAANTDGVAKQILQGDNVVVIVPRTVLAPGTYSVNASTAARSVGWSFTVDPSAALGTVVPVGVAQPTSPATGFAPLPPARIVDTRIPLGASRLAGQSTTRIQITGQVGVPDNAKAVLANATVAEPTGDGFLTLWNCSASKPEVSTLNFSLFQTVANTATIPLDAGGGLCAFSSVDADLVIDVGGYYSSTATGRYKPLAPRRLMDSRQGLGTASRLEGGEIVELSVVGSDIAANASAVALNVTGIFPSSNAFVTAYPCGDLPPTSSLNPGVGRITPNLVMAQVSTTGTVCLFSNAAVDLVVDAVGYVSSTTTNRFTPSTPFRFTDTRDASRPEVHAGQGGMRLVPGQILTIQMAGVRGIPLNAQAVSANLTAVDAVGGGFLTAWPCGALPTASNVNFEFGAPIANAAELPLSASGAICIYSSTAAHVIVDVNGWWS